MPIRIYQTKVYGSASQYSNGDLANVHGTLLGEPACNCAFLVDGCSSLTVDGHTLGVSSLSEIKRFTNSPYIVRSTSMTGINLYNTTTQSSGDGIIFRHSLDGSSSNSIFYGTQPYSVASIIIDDSAAYLMYDHDYYTDLRITKLNLVTGVETELYNEPVTGVTFDGSSDWELDTVRFAFRLRYNDIDHIIFVSHWYDNGTTYREAMRVHILDLSDDTVALDTFQHLLIGKNASGFAPGGIVQYNDKLVFVAATDEADSYTGALCPFPVFIIDCTNLTVTIVDNVTVNPLTGTWGDAYWGGAVDRASGIYYFAVEDYSADPTNYIYQVDLDTEVMSGVTGVNYNVYIVQVKDTPYALEQVPGPPKAWTLRSIPALTSISTATGDAVLRPPFTVDHVNEVVWFGYETSFHGLPVDGGTELDVDVFYDGGSPWDYTTSRDLSFFFCNNRGFVFTSSTLSSPPYTNQTEYILVGPVD